MVNFLSKFSLSIGYERRYGLHTRAFYAIERYVVGASRYLIASV